MLEALIAATEDFGIAKRILDKIFRIIGKGDVLSSCLPQLAFG
ncbi:MAG: hypothetical protein WAM14_04465 [Candidatus Nitrosopolaris sp.]